MVKRLSLILVAIVIAVALLALSALGQGQAAPAGKASFKFIGAKGCKMCHNTPAQGKQYDIWMASKHSKAYATLASPKAKEVATAKGIADPQKDAKCLKCHLTGYDAAKEMLTTTYSMEDGISCESCHGSGEKYKAMNIMKDKKLALENGLIIPDEKTCKGCHNPESPTYKEFKFEEAKKLIAHPKPKAQG
jgi:hypothetical protein